MAFAVWLPPPWHAMATHLVSPRPSNTHLHLRRLALADLRDCTGQPATRGVDTPAKPIPRRRASRGQFSNRAHPRATLRTRPSGSKRHQELGRASWQHTYAGRFLARYSGRRRKTRGDISSVRPSQKYPRSAVALPSETTFPVKTLMHPKDSSHLRSPHYLAEGSHTTRRSIGGLSEKGDAISCTPCCLHGAHRRQGRAAQPRRGGRAWPQGAIRR